MYKLNKSRELLDILIDKFNEYEEIFISVSFITWAGIQEVFNNVNNFEDKKIKIITTTDDFITDYLFLKKMFNLKNVEIKLLDRNKNSRSFHTKFFIFSNKNKKCLINGSLNLTYNSLLNKYEAINTIYNIEDIYESEIAFDYLWNKAEALTNNFIEDYKNKTVNLPIRAEINIIENDILEFESFSPNEMQLKSLKDLEEVRNKGEKKALLYAATGTGKTYLAAFDAKRFSKKKILYIVHNRAIINSVIKNFKNIFKSQKLILKLVSEKFDFVKEKDIIFSTEKTFIKFLSSEHKGELKSFDYFIFDEAHKIGKKSKEESNNQHKIFEIIEEELKNSNYFILGMTATPFRSDNEAFLIRDVFNRNVIGKFTIDISIEKGLISPFHYYGKNIKFQENEKKLDEKENKKINRYQVDFIIDKFIEELIKVELWKKEEKIKGLIFLETINEVDEAVDILNKKGYKSLAIHSKIESNDYKAADDYIEQSIFELESNNSKVNFLVTVNKFNEGVDIPQVNTIGMLRPTDSHIIYSQQIGRGLRKIEGKYLNIFDLVSNHEKKFKSGYQRMIALKGSGSVNPREIEKSLRYNNANKISNVEMKIDEIARETIYLSLLKHATFKSYFKEKIKELNDLYGEEIELYTLEEKLGESIQLIINNLKERRVFVRGHTSWIFKIFSEVLSLKEIKSEEMNDDEHIILELFSWMPFTVSTADEKKLILELMDGKEIKIASKWISYFIGKNIYTGTISQVVQDNEIGKYFSFNENDEKFIYKKSSNFSNSFIFLFGKIRDYLVKNLNKSDFMIKDFWYSKMEIGFMAGYTSNVVNAIFTKYSNDENNVIGDKDIFATNIFYGFKKNARNSENFKNKIIDKNIVIVSNNRDDDFSKVSKVHNFIGSDKFSNRQMYKYIGLPKEISFYEETKYETQNGYYNRFKVIMNGSMNEKDYDSFW